MTEREEFHQLLNSLTNQGRWGDDDEKGAVNHIKVQKRLEAAGLVRQGKTFSLSLPITHGVGPATAAGRSNPHHFMTSTGCDPTQKYDLGENARYTDDFLAFYPQGGTQWDALCHIYYDDKLYNGFPSSHVSSTGADRVGIDKVHSDFISRGVLLDIARLKGVDKLEDGYAITVEDLEEAEQRQGVRVEEGDMLIFRTGLMTEYKNFTDFSVHTRPEPGLHWRTAAWLNERRVATVSADNLMVEASGVLEGAWVPFHMLALCNLGIHLGELWYLEELAADCAADGVWEFMLIAQALPITGGAGSAVNPIALK